MEIVIFGTGKFYQEKKGAILSDIRITAFLDNNPELQGTYMDCRPIVSPGEIRRLSYDKIILMSASEEAMKCQLLELSVKEDDIWYWERFISEMYHGTLKLHCGSKNFPKEYKRKILIISTYLNYNGGTLAAAYAAEALQEHGNLVVLAAPDGDKAFISEVTESGIDVVLCPSISYLHKEELLWVRQFDLVLVNVFQMISCACEISRIRPVLWWIHEPTGVYPKIVKRFQKYMNSEQVKAVNIYAVSPVAQKNFNFYFTGRIKKVLLFGIPDQRKANPVRERTEFFTFALTGAVIPEKGQNIFLKAVNLLNTEEKRNVRFWLIGFIGTDEYSDQIRELVEKETAAEILGQLTRDEIYKVYEEVDVVVCPSLEETLSVAAVEGMMYGKACVVSDKTGIAQYIKNEENGFICKAGDPEDLCKKMKWIIHNREKLPAIGKKARDTYEAYFSMKSFGERLETALQNTDDYWLSNK